MKVNVRVILAALAVAVIAALAASARPASAMTLDGSSNCTVSGLAQLCISDQHVSFGNSTLSDKETVVTTGKGTGVLQLRWEMPKGWKPASKKGCHWVTGGTNSYIGANGKRYWIDWTGKRAYICPSKSSPTGWRKAGGPPHWEPCGNVFAPPGKPHPRVFRGKYKVVHSFTWTATVTLKVTLPADVYASAWCSVPGASASATASGHGSASASITGKASASTRFSAVGRATGKAQLSDSQKTSLMLSASKQASINMTASARTVCTAVLPPGTPPPPPPTTTPPTPPSTPTPTPPPPHSCTVGAIVEKDDNGRFVRANVNVDSTNGPSGSINWGDGGTTPGLSGSHVYGGNGPWTITASYVFNDGGKAVCSTSVSTPYQAPPPPPPAAPGPDPTDPTGGAGGTTAPGGGTTGGGYPPCPPGWTWVDPSHPEQGCMPQP